MERKVAAYSANTGSGDRPRPFTAIASNDSILVDRYLLQPIRHDVLIEQYTSSRSHIVMSLDNVGTSVGNE